VVDTVGGTTFNGGGFRSLAPYGRYVFVGQINDEFARFAVPFLFWKEATLTGTSTPDYLDMKDGMALVASGKITSVISETAGLDDTARLHALLEQKQIAGRAVILP
jgi:D-arabinose 1-dehydrogenase-like Zn-dependent alcohol dehydrogenase